MEKSNFNEYLYEKEMGHYDDDNSSENATEDQSLIKNILNFTNLW